MNEIENEIKMHLQEFVEDCIMNGMKFNGREKQLVYLNKELLDIEDFIEILATNDLRTFLKIECRYDDDYSTVKNTLKFMAQSYGFKFSNAFVVKCFREVQRSMASLFISPSPEGKPVGVVPTHQKMLDDMENLNRVNYLYIKLCQAINIEPNENNIYYDVAVDNEETTVTAHNEEEQTTHDMVLEGNAMQVQVFFNKLEENRF